MLLLAGIVLAMHTGAPEPTVVLKAGTVIYRTCKVSPREYFLPAPPTPKGEASDDFSEARPALTIKGNDVVVDFGGATIRGTPANVEPDKRRGLGVVVEGNNVTIRNLRVHGFKIGLWAKGCRGLRVIDGDFSYNWKQHLASTVEQEDESDWQSYHHNENNEWMRYGAALYLEGCQAFEVMRTRANGGQCGLMLVRSDEGMVKNNDFSFNSGVGLGLYRSSRNSVYNNRIDWCVRGFSYGVYNRGQDSAGILVFESCNTNLFAFNSVTHGGDGFFLWAGQTMMDTGKAGCNDNLLYGNDFSHSPCNAIEATFSHNSFVNNKLVECWHGVWGGYSFDTKIVGNTFGFNGEAIAIEHGQDNTITHNLFYRDTAAIDLWQNPADDTGSYGRHHDTVSRDYQISGNQFVGIPSAAIVIRNTRHAIVKGNAFRDCASAFKEGGDNPDTSIDIGGVVQGKVPPQTIQTSGQPVPGTSDDVGEYLSRFNLGWAPYAQVAALKTHSRSLTAGEQRVLDGGFSIPVPKDGQNAFLKPGALCGQRYILIDEWGPYDFKSPLLCPRQVLSSNDIGQTERRFEILGPKGRWRALNQSEGVGLSRTSGTVPGFVDVVTSDRNAGETRIELEYIGGATTDYRGIVTPAGRPVRFGYNKVFIPIDWNVKFFKWDDSTDPRTHDDLFKKLIEGEPIKSLKLNKLDYAGGTFDPAVGGDHFATICDGTFQVPAGAYKLELATDDGARAWVDGKPVITDAWHYQGPTLYTATLTLDGSPHQIRVEHFQIDGYARLKVDLKPVVQ